MDRLETKRKNALVWAIALSIGLPLGIFMIVFGFTHGKSTLAMAIVGIVVTVISFYGTPLIWIRFGQLSYFKNLRNEILEGIRSVNMLAGVHNKAAKEMANDVKTLIQKGYLNGYVILDNEKIIDKNAMSRRDYEALEAERSGNLNLVNCPFCNAKFAMILDVEECPYCKSKITKGMLETQVKAYNKKD